MQNYIMPSIKVLFSLAIIMINYSFAYSQEVPILEYTLNENGQVQLKVNSTPDHYYILKVKIDPNSNDRLPTSMTLGEEGTTIITESLSAQPLSYYQVLEYSINMPFDTDDDGVDDMTEYQNIPIESPINAALPIAIEDGLTTIDSFTNFKRLSLTKDVVQYSEFLNGKGFVKFIIVDFNTDHPKTYFINSSRYDLHADFAEAVDIEHLGDEVKRGQVIFHPLTIANNGKVGTFVFNYSNGHGKDFDVVQKTHEILAANMPFVNNNLSYFITPNSEDEFERDMAFYDDSRISILFEADLYAEVDYWGLNQTEGFGFFREVTLEEIPGPRDMVLYDILPNNLPRVGGIITSVIQTPLSHVNLRAIQNNIPNAFIRDPLAIDSIANLLNGFIYFKVEQGEYFIREASLEEVNDWFEDQRPTEKQDPPLNLDYTDILPLDEINFDMFDGFGAKCTNVATMRTFGLPDGTIPNGFGIPFYYYQEFMKHHQFFEEVEWIISQPGFLTDRILRDDLLDDFRKKIRAAEMPDWILDELATMQAAFPEGISIRCRSSSNNEDLPGFNGAGLYTSKTQHPDEGHISKSVKQVYASLWNLRAFEERDFYRIDHFASSMGILCHPNYQNEKANGVGVSTDPVYNTSNTFYLNSQIGEELVTNPSAASIPEEILLDRFSVSENDFIVVQRSNLLSSDSLIMGERYLDEMRDYLSVIHDEFEILYNAVGNDNFAMDIEYKITANDQLIIKQARPWVSFILAEDSISVGGEAVDLTIFPNPARDYVAVKCSDCQLTKMTISDILGRQIQEKIGLNPDEITTQMSINELSAGVYLLSGFTKGNKINFTRKFVKY